MANNPLRTERFPALLLLLAAVVGLVLANSPAGVQIISFSQTELSVPTINLSIAHWVADLLLAFFFFVVAVELQGEFRTGALSTLTAAIRPVIGAAGGVLVPIAIYLLIAGGEATHAGWPIATATDVAFALGVLAVFGRGLPGAVRAFLLAVAIFDDLVGITLIAVLFSNDIDLLLLGLAAAVVAVFAWLSRMRSARGRGIRIAAMVVLAATTWVLVYHSGVHATLAGVALGLAMSYPVGERVREALVPAVNGAVLPIFAFVSALVVIPTLAPSELSPAFTGIAIALPIGKIIGITLFGWLAMRLPAKNAGEKVPFLDLVAIGALGGIGFTVALLIAALAFADDAALRDQATLGVLAGSAIALVLSAIIVSWRAAHYRRAAALVL